MDLDEYEYLEKSVEDEERDDCRMRTKKSRSRGKSRDTSRERERQRRERGKSRDTSRERERQRRSRREIEELREIRRYKDKKETVEPEADPERDQRTVFAYQMPLKATERDVYEFFSKAGKVRDVRLIMDRNSRRSKGVGYIEFYDVMSVPMAIAMSGQLLLGQPVMVKPSEAEKNLVQSNASGGSSVVGPYGATERKLYVGNLHFNMTELQLKQIFEAFGPVELIQLPLDPETGHCKGFGFVQFAQLEHAKAAQNLNGTLEIAGRTIKVSSVTDHIAVQDSGAKTADFDDDEGGGLALNAQSRALLMQKLDRTGFASSVVGTIGAPALNGAATSQLTTAMPMAGTTAIPTPILRSQVLTSMPPEPIGNPSECLLLKNMFDPATETDPEFDLDIKDDVYEECSKYGHVKHIHVDKNSAGYVYLRFDNVEGASRAQQAMHRRWFARRLISAIYLQPYEYDAKFKGGAA
ncbi:RNA splicing factor [Lithospermum erythrorhizon]|uniref:RNA splicing factor n=1 Tax=Lithospermum erythrorhizon TaxID=34254 RepID=A0AAV3P567_LITER